MKLGMATRGPSGPVAPEGAPTVPGYRATRRIGAGRTSEVWDAEGPGGFPVALKVARPDGVGQSEATRVVVTSRAVRHPNLLPTLGAWRDGGSLVLALERADRSLGDELRDALAAGAAGLPAETLIADLTPVVEALDYLAEPGRALAHRDVRPANLMRVGGGVKLSELLGACPLDDPTAESAPAGLDPVYAAPEVLAGIATRGSDQYALAVSYCVLRGGRTPFAGDLTEQMTGHLLHPPDLTMVGEAERPALARALAKRPEERWPSCVALLRTLRADLDAANAAAARAAVAASRAEESRRVLVMPPDRRGGGGAWRGVAAAVFVVAGGLALFQGRHAVGRVAPWLAGRAATASVSLVAREIGQFAPTRPHVVLRPAVAALAADPAPAPAPEPPPAVRVEPPVAWTPPADATPEPAPAVPELENLPPVVAQEPPAPAVDPASKPQPLEVVEAPPLEAPKAETPPVAHPVLAAPPVGPTAAELAARAEAKRKAGDRAGALADLDEALKLRPDDTGTLNLRALTHVGLGDPYKAIADFDRALRLSPGDAALHYNRGWVYFQLGDPVESRAEFDAAIRLDPALAPAYRARAEAFDRQGDAARARLDREAAARLESPSRPVPAPLPAAAPGPAVRSAQAPAPAPRARGGLFGMRGRQASKR